MYFSSFWNKMFDGLSQVSDEPKVSKKDRRMAKRGRRKERRATKQTDEQARVKSVPKTQSRADRVLERKLVNRHSEAIAKHKVRSHANHCVTHQLITRYQTKSKHSKLQKSSRAKNSVV
jgi:hypothetical protein